MLKVANIGKILGSKRVVRGITINVESGEIVGIMGPNGAGKTSSFYMIAGFIFPDYGSITLNENDITKLPVYQRARLGIGYLPQESTAFADLSVRDNIMMAIEIYHHDQRSRKQKLNSLLEEFNIAHLSSIPAKLLSGGERRRVEIARCLAIEPRYILLDEPFAGIDPISINDIMSLIKYLKKEKNVGILITDHNVREALSIIERGYIMYDGKVIAEGTAKQLKNNAKARQLYLGDNFN